MPDERATIKAIVILLTSVFLFIQHNAHAALFKTRGDKMFAAYFKAEADRLAADSLKEVKTLADWKDHKDRYRREMHEMLGLDPVPPRTPLMATVTGKVQHEEFEVWKLHYQSIPKLYVTANLYVPKGLKKPAPTILYVCGHGRVKKDGVSFGNKLPLPFYSKLLIAMRSNSQRFNVY